MLRVTVDDAGLVTIDWDSGGLTLAIDELERLGVVQPTRHRRLLAAIGARASTGDADAGCRDS